MGKYPVELKLGAEEADVQEPEHQLADQFEVRPSPSPSVPVELAQRRRCPFEKGRRLPGQYHKLQEKWLMERRRKFTGRLR
jgi:hypothetical protein